jgi:hypothetical protein
MIKELSKKFSLLYKRDLSIPSSEKELAFIFLVFIFLPLLNAKKNGK